MHECRTYFNIMSELPIDIDLISKELSISKNEITTTKHPNSIEIGNYREYDVDVNKMVRKTLTNLLGKEDILIELKEKYNFTYYLERVIEIDSKSEEPKPIMSLDNDIVEFLFKSKTIDDLDYYIY